MRIACNTMSLPLSFLTSTAWLQGKNDFQDYAPILGLQWAGPATWGILENPGIQLNEGIWCFFLAQFKSPEKWSKQWIWQISRDVGNMLKSTHRKFKKRVRKIPKSNKKASSEAILLIIWPKMEPKEGNDRRLPPSFWSGRRPPPFWVT